jgi:hypothetical protein
MRENYPLFKTYNFSKQCVNSQHQTHRGHVHSALKDYKLVRLVEICTVHSQNHTKWISKLCGENM